MFAAVKGVVRKIFNYSRLWLPAPSPPERSQRSPSPPPVRFCELPLEMLAMILEELDWRDILRIRETCSALQKVSKTRSIWLKLCGPYLAPTATAPQILHPERPIKLYKSHELEFLFSRLKSAEIGWKTDDQSLSRKRQFVTATRPKCMYLVEGGRWLLVASETGSISYFDLDAQTPTEGILIPDQFDHRSKTRITMAIDRDNSSPFLVFNLVVCSCAVVTPTPDPKEHQVQIWKVSLALDEQQQATGLEAELLASFPQQRRINRIYSLSLLGSDLALSVFCIGYNDPKRTFIIDWEQANGDSNEYPMRMLHPQYGQGPETIHLLPGNKLFAAAYEGLMIFDYACVKEITSMPPLDHLEFTAVPIWEERTLDLRETAVSRPFFCSSSIRFSIRGRDYLFGVILNYPYDEDPSVDLAQVVKLSEFPPIPEFSEHPVYGYNKAAIVEGCDDTHLFAYLWPDEENHQLSPVWLHQERVLKTCTLGPFLDEGSGRVIVSSDDNSRESHCHDIWDFSRV